MEILFGRCRAMNGFNDNPTVQQFMGAFRKLMAFDAILCSSSSNCTDDHTPSQPFANILYVTSIPNTANATDIDISSSQLATLYQKLSEIEAIEKSSLLDCALDYSIAFVGANIEQRIASKDRMYCDGCKNVFEENTKLRSLHLGFANSVPCRSTFDICKEADRFLKLQLIRSSQNFNVIEEGIYQQLDLEDLFVATVTTMNTNIT